LHSQRGIYTPTHTEIVTGVMAEEVVLAGVARKVVQ
jgi:hypothetical protein